MSTGFRSRAPDLPPLTQRHVHWLRRCALVPAPLDAPVALLLDLERHGLLASPSQPRITASGVRYLCKVLRAPGAAR